MKSNKGWACMKKVLLSSLVFLIYTQVIYATPILSQTKNNIPSHKVLFESERAMISRDGSEAIPIKKGTVLSKPGTYYLSLYDGQTLTKIQKVVIPFSDKRTVFKVKKEQELEEILKQALENFTSTIKIEFTEGEYNIDQLSTLVSHHLENLMTKYPKLVCQGNRIVYQGYSNKSLKVKHPTVQIDLIYPLQVTESLRRYEEKTNHLISTIMEKTLAEHMTDYEIEKVLFEYILQHTTYSQTMQKGTNYVSPTALSHTLYGGLVDGRAVCDGYAKSLMYLLNSAGIPTRFIVGTTYEGEAHAWNLVKIQGAYYHVDATWADQEDKGSIGSLYDYFNEQDTYMRSTHRWNEVAYPKAITSDYSIPYSPLSFEDVYKVRGQNDLEKVLQLIKVKKINGASIIFLNQKRNRWDEEKLVSEIVRGLRKGISYRSYTKEDCLIISFNA